ncbi:MAG: protein kinase [Pyrinomonadaceae bacterium]
MGEVYLARDLQLERTVALKVLPANFALDPAKMLRFIQEAKAASALNHPNIITIHEIGQYGPSRFIATEYIDGQTLRDLIATRPLDIAEILDIASQVTSALVVAHAAGIIHRDIKPENIMVRPDGYVKVLDFGLCKLTEAKESDPTSVTLATTDPNVIMGTPSYMSPEQIRGLDLDGRTDIWSLGAVVYEMITGRKAFDGSSTGDIIVAVLEREPLSFSYYSDEVPAQLESVVFKSLRKARDERYQTVREVFTDFRYLKHHLQIDSNPILSPLANANAFAKTTASVRDQLTVISPAPFETGARTAATGSGQTHLTAARRSITQLKRYRRPAALVTVTLCIFLAGAAAGIIYYVARRANSAAVLSTGKTVKSVRLTTSGKTTRAAISPDGKYVAFASSDGDKQSLWIRQVAINSQVQIVSPQQVVYRGLTFSHDGNFIYSVVQEENNPVQVLYQVPVLGGVSRKVLSGIDSPISLSPNNLQMAFIRRDRVQGEDSLMIATVDGAGERTLAAKRGEEFLSISGPSWSPDGSQIVYGVGTRAGGRFMSIAAVRIADGSERN